MIIRYITSTPCKTPSRPLKVTQGRAKANGSCGRRAWRYRTRCSFKMYSDFFGDWMANGLFFGTTPSIKTSKPRSTTRRFGPWACPQAWNRSGRTPSAVQICRCRPGGWTVWTRGNSLLFYLRWWTKRMMRWRGDRLVTRLDPGPGRSYAHGGSRQGMDSVSCLAMQPYHPPLP